VVADVAVAEPIDVTLVFLHQPVERLTLASLAGRDGIAIVLVPP